MSLEPVGKTVGVAMLVSHTVGTFGCMAGICILVRDVAGAF